MDIINRIRRFGMEFMGRYYGTYMAIVLDNSDFQDRGKLTVRVSDISGAVNRRTTCFYKGLAGDQTGLHWVPPVGDIVFIEYRGGSPQEPYWVSSYFSKGSKPGEFTPDDVAFTFSDGTVIRNNSQDKELIIKHCSGTTIKLSDKTISLDGRVSLDSEGLKFKDSNLIDGEFTNTSLNDLSKGLLNILVVLASTGYSDPTFTQALTNIQAETTTGKPLTT